MNQPNPFNSKQSAQDQLNKSRTRLRLAVFGALAMCLFVLVPLLLVQGCKREESPAIPVVDTNAPPMIDDTNLPPIGLDHTNIVLPPIGIPPIVNPSVAPVAPVAPVATGNEHVVAKGDSFYTIGKKYGVSTKAIGDANPGVDSKKLKIGQKLNIPAAAAGVTGAVAPVGAPAVEAAAGEKTYTVKSGDTLTRIAKSQGASLKAIKSANNLTTDRIKVGQKLKIPVKASAPATAPVVEAAPVIIPSAAPSLPPLTPTK